MAREAGPTVPSARQPAARRPALGDPRQSLLLGYLLEGDQLPTVKEVAGDLAINPNTVVKAYRQLEHEGLAAGRPGQGHVHHRHAGRAVGAGQCGAAGLAGEMAA